MWIPKIDKSKRGVYRTIVEKMREDIEAGILKSGDQLPPQRDLAWALKVNLTTVSRAYREAVRQHLIGGEVGRGTYILANSAEASLFELKSKKHNETLNKLKPNDEFVDFSTNIPARNVADKRFKTSMAEIIENYEDTLFEEYHAPILLDALKIAATKWLNWRNMPSKPDNIILAGGAQTALQAILISLCKSGDSILVEEFTFPGMKDFARQFGLKLIPVKMDDQGILPDDLNETASKNRAKFIVLVPNHQNPTGAVMSEMRQESIAQIIESQNLTLIEDDVYGGLSGMPPLSNRLRNNSIYLTSLSKTVSFGLRLGFIWASDEYFDILNRSTNLTQWPLSPIMMQLAINWIEDGTAFDKANWQRIETNERRKIAENILEKDSILTRDKNCPHLWIRICCQAHFSKACEVQQVNIAAAPIFIPNNKLHNNAGVDMNYIRLSLVAPSTRQNLAIGLKKIAKILQTCGR